MKKFDKWFFPDHEEHLTELMQNVNKTRHGRLTYQAGKYDMAMPHVKQKRLAVDVGSHVGLWAFLMAHDFEKVMCFEPMPAHAECWRENMRHIENATLIECALGETVGTARIGTRTANSSGDTGVLLPGQTYSQLQIAPMQTLDYFELDDVDFLKIDCEGYEEFVLRGGVEMLKRCKPCVIVEQKGVMSEKYGLAQKSAVEFLESLGAKLRGEISGDYILAWD